MQPQSNEGFSFIITGFMTVVQHHVPEKERGSTELIDVVQSSIRANQYYSRLLAQLRCFAVGIADGSDPAIAGS
eukprot:scaffold294872_cov49-Attheya_sp.AAC.1